MASMPGPSRRSSRAPKGRVTADQRVGTVLAERYRIDALLGEGGMGRVYAAEHVLMRKRLAIKVLHRELTTVPEVVARFEREAMAAANIEHANVAAATDFGKLADGSVFLVLEFVQGKNLRDEIATGPFSEARALHVARQIASALGSAHALNIVHRDLKPENVMLVDRGGDPDFVKVLDFGIAKVPIGEVDRAPTAKTAARTPITKAGMVFGTPEYMAPEQALGQTVDGRADLYALGVILFEMLAGVAAVQQQESGRYPRPAAVQAAPQVLGASAGHRRFSTYRAARAQAAGARGRGPLSNGGGGRRGGRFAGGIGFAPRREDVHASLWIAARGPGIAARASRHPIKGRCLRGRTTIRGPGRPRYLLSPSDLQSDPQAALSSNPLVPDNRLISGAPVPPGTGGEPAPGDPNLAAPAPRAPSRGGSGFDMAALRDRTRHAVDRALDWIDQRRKLLPPGARRAVRNVPTQAFLGMAILALFALTGGLLAIVITVARPDPKPSASASAVSTASPPASALAPPSAGPSRASTVPGAKEPTDAEIAAARAGGSATARTVEHSLPQARRGFRSRSRRPTRRKRSMRKRSVRSGACWRRTRRPMPIRRSRASCSRERRQKKAARRRSPCSKVRWARRGPTSSTIWPRPRACGRTSGREPSAG